MSTRKPISAINITPLVDVLLIVMVVLMLSMPMYAKRLPITLPETGLNGQPLPSKTLRITLAESGTLTVGGAPGSLDDAQAAVTGTTTVEIAADGKANYDQLAKLIAALQERKPKEIVLATR